MSGDNAGWCTIESDPGVFTELLRSIGVKRVQVEEIYSIDPVELSRFDQVHGVVFLFHYRPDEAEKARARSGRIISPPPNGLFFAHQTIRNACATQAILSIVLNSAMDVGTELQNFRHFTADMDPSTRGMVISNSETIRTAHNSFTVQQSVEVDDKHPEQEDAFHFVAFVPFEGCVYELDGLQQGPREVGEYGDSTTWLEVVTPFLMSRIAEYGDGEIRFNLMVVVDDPREGFRNQLKNIRAEHGEDSAQAAVIQSELGEEEEKHARWDVENARRRWNFMPLAIELLKVLAKAGQIDSVIEEATQRKQEAYKKAMAKKEKGT